MAVALTMCVSPDPGYVQYVYYIRYIVLLYGVIKQAAWLWTPSNFTVSRASSTSH